VVSRILLIVLFVFNLIEIAGSKERLSSFAFLVNFLFFIYLILNVVLCIKELKGQPKNNITAIITGVSSIVMSIIIFYLLTSFKTRNTGLGFILAFWLMLLGLFDIGCIDKATLNAANEEDINES